MTPFIANALNIATVRIRRAPARDPGLDYTGKTISWVIETRGLCPLIWWHLGYVNARSPDQAIEKARAKWPGRRRLVAYLKQDQ